MNSLHSLLLLLALAPLCVFGQAPSPPPIWPAEFDARFGLYMFDVPSNAPIFNLTSYFLYNIDIGAQLIQYPDRCVPIAPGGDLTPCNILFHTEGIYFNQPSLGIECCTLYAGVGPTPRNFTRGFNWNGTAPAFDFFNTLRDSDYYVNIDATFKYWTEVNTHHDVLFRDGSGAFWAWDHLHVAPQDPSNFNLFSDPTTCAQSCSKQMELKDEEAAAMMERAKNHGPIQLALHHHELKMKEKKHHHHSHKKHH